MNPPGSSVLHHLVDWLRERYTPSPEGWWDVDVSEEEELAAFNEGRPDPAAPFTADELETLAYLERVRAARAKQLARHRWGFWNALIWLVVGVVWSSGTLVELVRSPKRGVVLLGSGMPVVAGGFTLGHWFIAGRVDRRVLRGG